ncbi:hypothetical protein [Streptomyces sp. NPDC013455]|uniref:hypothetical protein n=1 Tax=Streptomyces sp. NPDC013455 TaxID=3155605 RepID=UPI0033D0E711
MPPAVRFGVNYRPRAVEQLVALADAAAERGLDVTVDGLQGHLGSFDFLPAWTRTWHRRNLFTDPDVTAADEPHRPVWLQEVGAPAPLVPAEHAAAFAEATITHVLDCPDLWGVTWWCSHDVPRALADFPELEYSLGLFTGERRPKDIARVLAEAARRTHRAPAVRGTALVVPAAPARRSRCAPGGEVFDAFFRLVADGAGPTTVLDTRAGDGDHLAARGITGVVTPGQVLSTPRGGTRS